MSLEEIVVRSFLPRDSAEDALDSLTQRGYVGGQLKAFALTESGRNLFTRLIAQLGKFEAEQLSGISQQDLAVTRSVLEKLYDRLRISQQPGLQHGTQFSNAASDSATGS